MGFLSEIRGLDYKLSTLYVSAFFGTVASGFLIIFQFRPELIEKYDDFKLIFLSLALTMPLGLVNVINMVLHNHESDSLSTEASERRLTIISGAFMLNAMLIYPPLLVCYLFSLRFKWFLGMLLLWEFLIFLSGLASRFSKRVKK